MAAAAPRRAQRRSGWITRSSRAWIVGLALLYLGALWFVIARELDRDHQGRLAQAAIDAGNLAHAFERGIDTTVRAVDTALEMLRRDFALQPDKFDDTVRTVLATSLKGIALQVGRVDAQGRLVYVRPAGPQLPLDVSDRPHVRAQLDEPGDRLFVGPLTVLRTTGQPALPFTRPIRNGAGETVGVLTILVRPGHFSDLYAGLNIGRTGLVELVRDGEVLLARHSPQAPAEVVGRLMPASTAERVGGQLIQASPIDGVRRIVAERRHPALPLTLRVGLGEAEVLEQHERLQRELLIVGALLTAALLLANAHLLRLDRRLRQARLRAAAGEARLRNIIENIDAVAWEIDLPSWRWTYVSPQAERLFGYPIGRWLEDPSFWIDHVHPDDRQAALQYRVDCTARGEDHALEFRFRASDGRELWLRDIVRVVRDSAGVPSRLTGVLVDISARVQSEQELRRERSLLHNLIDTIPDLIFVKDTEGVYRGTNSAFQHFVGRPGANLAGRTDHDLFDPLLADFFRGRDRMVLASMLPQRNEEWVTYPDGRRVLLDTLKAPFQGDDGRPLGLIGVSRDITELKQNQDRLTLAKTVFDVTAEAIMVTDAEGRIVTVNPAFESFTGLKQAQVLGSDGRALRSPRQDDAFYTQIKAKLERRGRWNGELWMRRHDGSDFPAWLTAAESRDSDGRRTGWVFAFSDISRLKRQEHQIWQQANFDALTGLANRHQFQARLERALAQARRQKTTVGLMFIDLDRFKWINDSLGHEAGDAVLVEAGRRLRQCVREVDTVARLGGDEFTIVLEGMVGHEPLSAVADKVLHALSTPFVVQAAEQHLSGSVGITVFPHDAADASTLLRFADIAMYRAKEAGRGRHAFYSPDMQRDMQARQKAEDGLRAALEQGGFVLHYQPIVELQTGRACAAEALLRLVDAERGLLEPVDFLAAAEDSGLMATIGAWVVDAACAQWRRWADAGLPVLPVAINVAGAQLRAQDLQQTLAAARQRHRVPVEQLTLDVGAALLADPAAGAVERLLALQRSGVPITVDRCGGDAVNAPLALLQVLQVHRLKIDRSLLARCPGDEGARRLAAAIAAMALEMGLQPVAVGVETPAQREFARGIGCLHVQGYLMGPPLDAEAFAGRHLGPT